MTRAPFVLALALAGSLLACVRSGTPWTFTIENHDTLALDSAKLDVAGTLWAAGSLAPGRDTAVTVRLVHDEILHLNGLRAGQPFRVVLGGYAAKGPGGAVRIVITPGGSLDIGSPTAP